MAIEVVYVTTATNTFLDLQSGFARPYWEVNITVSGNASTISGCLGAAYSNVNHIISMGTIDREKPVIISGLSKIVAGDFTMTLDNICGTYSPRHTGSIFCDAAGSAKDWMHSIINVWAGFEAVSGTAFVLKRGSFLLTKLRIDSSKRQAFITGEDVASIPLQRYVGLPDLSGTSTYWEPSGGWNTKNIMEQMLSGIGVSSSQYDIQSGLIFNNYHIVEGKVDEELGKLAQANDGYLYTDNAGKIVFKCNAPVFGGASSDMTIYESDKICSLKYNIDLRDLINRVQINYTSGSQQSRTSQDTSVIKGRTQIITNETIDRASIANSLASKLLIVYRHYRPTIEIDNVWLPSLQVGNIIDVYDANTYHTGVSFEVFRIRDDIDALKTKIYAVDLTENEIYGTHRQKWGFASSSDVANCGTDFSDYWSSGFAFVSYDWSTAINPCFDLEGNNDNVVDTGLSVSGAGCTGIELPFLTY